MRNLIVLALASLVLSASVAVGTSAAGSFTANTPAGGSVSNLLAKSANSQGNSGLLKVYSASGETKNLSLPLSTCGLTALTVGNNTSIFINDLVSGQKTDFLLANYTKLTEEEYLNNGKVRVIALTGDLLADNTYKMHLLNEAETFTLSQIALGYNATILSKSNAFPFVSLEIPYEEVSAFSHSSLISHVFLDKKEKVCLNESVPIIRPREKWQEIESSFGSSINGSGIKIAILDTGIDSTHPDLRGKVVLECGFTGEGKTSDGFGHGTHVASIAAGTGMASNGTYVGVAPGAFLLNGKVLGDDGMGWDTWIISGITWAVQQGAQVISMSFGNGWNGDGTDPLSIAVDWATDQGAVCVAAAGNDGWQGMSSVGSPGVARKVITVGATTKDDYVASFSSQGPTSDLRLKPDVLAPGVDIVAARANGTSMGSIVNQYYTMASGTSMATPHVAGASALIRQVHPDWSPVMVKSALMGNAKALSGEHLWRQGAGRMDVADATNATLLVIEPSGSFGSLSTNPLNTSFTVMSTVGYEQFASLSTLTTCESVVTDYVKLSVNSLIIPAYESVRVEMTVGPFDDNAPEGWYEGWFQLTVDDRVNTALYLFLVQSTIRVSVYDVDGTRVEAYVLLAGYPDPSFKGSAWASMWYPEDAIFHVASGTYSILASAGWIMDGFTFEGGRAFMIQKVVTVSRKFSTVDVRISLADAAVSEIPTVDSRGRNLLVHAYSMYFSGDNTHSYTNEMSWSTQWMWLNFDINTSKLIFYSSQFSPADEFSEAFGFSASNEVRSEVYLLNWKWFNTPNLPSVWKYETANLAKYKMTYDMPETYPIGGINVESMFWFTWDHMSWVQTWFWEFHKVAAGIEATFYLTPSIAWYEGYYMPTYWSTYPLYGPLQYWFVGDFWSPPHPKETGVRMLGRFNFGPYVPGLSLRITRTYGQSVVDISGDLWANLDRPRSWSFLEYPTWLPYYHLYADGSLVAEGSLARWTDISSSWVITGQRALLQISMPGFGTISRETVYSVNFSLAENLDLPSFFYDLTMPLSYVPDRNMTIIPRITDTPYFHVSNVSLSYSFDNGDTWRVAKSTFMTRFAFPCQASEGLGIMLKAVDDKGNSFEYRSNPVALSRIVEVNVDATVTLISLEARTLDGNPVPSVALKIETTDSSFYVALDSSGRANLLSTIDPFKVWFPMVGLYDKTLATKPDVAVVDICLSSNEVYSEKIVNISVTVKNYGTFIESFSVKAYYNNTQFGTLTVSDLYPGTNCTLIFSLNTTILTPYVSYTIKAEATVVAYETNVANNALSKGNLTVRAMGDVNNDRRVDILDITSIALIYGCRQGDPNWNPYADLAPAFGKIDILDLVTCARHYGV